MWVFRTASLVVAGLSLVAVSARAGGPAPENREATFAKVCRSGTNGGASCTNDTDCPRSSCEVLFEQGSLSALVTIMVDDDVSAWDGSQTITGVRAATVLIEVRKNGTQLITQTYQTLAGTTLSQLIANLQDGAFLSDTFFPVTEESLILAAGAPDLLGRFLFQTADGGMGDRLKAIAGVDGTPVIIGVPKKLDQVVRADHNGDSTGSVIRLKVKIGFLAPTM